MDTALVHFVFYVTWIQQTCTDIYHCHGIIMYKENRQRINGFFQSSMSKYILIQTNLGDNVGTNVSERTTAITRR